jgi:hypothetical protein
MAMTVAELRARLSGITPGQTFTLADTDLGIDAVRQLFNNYLPGKTLTVTDATADATNLVVTGGWALPPNYPGLPATVTFPNEGTNVTSIEIRAALPAWDVKTRFLQISPDYLKAFGFKVLYLVLGTVTDATSGQDSPAYGVGTDFSLTADGGTQTLSFNALMEQDPNADYTLEGVFKGITLSDLNALTQFVGGGEFNIIPADVVPIAEKMELTGMRVAIGRAMSKVLVASIDVRVAPDWQLIPGKFEFNAVGATFTVVMPSTVSAILFTDFTAFSMPFEAQISIPDLNLEASLMEPVSLTKVLDQYLPNTELPEVLIDYLRFQLNMRTQGYSIQCATAESWTLVDPIELTGLFFNISGQSTSGASGTVGATFDIGGVGILVSATYGGATAGWQFLGETIGDATIDAGAFVADVLSKFKIQLPDAVKQVKLSNIAVTFDTGGPNFSFTCTGLFQVVNENVSITVDIALNYNQVAKAFDKDFKGTIVISPRNDPDKKYIFKVIFDENPTSTLLTLEYTGADPVDMQDILSGIGLTGFTPPGLDLSLSAASFSYDFTKKQLVLTAKSVNYGSASFVSMPVNNASEYFFGLAVNETLNLSNLPLIRSVLPKDDTVEIEKIQFSISSNAVAANDPSIPVINNLINQQGSGYPNIPAAGIGAGVGLSMIFSAGQWQTPFSISTDTSGQNGGVGQKSLPPPATSPATGGNPPPQQASDGTMWFDLQKTFGPVTFQKVGVRYQDSVLYLLMNASLSAGGLSISVMGLGAGSPLTTFDLHFSINGIAITFQEGPVDISGALVGTLEPEINFYGELMLGFTDFQISALGGYAQADGHPSFFLYAVLDYPLGGPSFFFVTGLAAGFGYNRSLVIPDVSGVATFPLVQWATGSGNPPAMSLGGNIGQQVSQVLTTLQTTGVVAPSVGSYWLALGLMFTSFEIVNSFALLTVTFGTKFEIDLLGLSTLSIPPDDPSPVAQVQIELKVSFSPDTGLLAIAGQLTPQSYVLSQSCHLTGGFAFYLWFAGDHAGEVVLTLGGYNPNFTVPTYYPQVPRIGMNWQVTDDLSITGELYFALTSNAVMAGGKMSAVWQSGSIRAWFAVWADFLMVFKPFHYYIDAGIDLGASFSIKLLFVRITISIHIGVNLEIWGPPFAGKATIDLSIISFTIHFGAQTKDTSTSIPWSDFVNTLLPSQSSSRQSAGALTSSAPAAAGASNGTPAPVQINVTQGMIKGLAPINNQPTYLVSGETFRCSVTSAIPTKGDPTCTGHVKMAPDAQQPHDKDGNLIQPNENFGAGPAGIQPADFNPAFTLEVDTDTDSVFLAVRMLNSSSKALWENKTFDPNTGVPHVDPGTGLTQTTLPNTQQGFLLVPTPPTPDHTLAIPLPALEWNLDAHINFEWGDATYPTGDAFTSAQTVASTINTVTVSTVRGQLLTAMGGQGITIDASVNVSSLSDSANNDLLAAPQPRLLGEQKGVS